MAENTPTQNKTAQNTCYLITICLFLERVSTRDMAVHKLSHTPVSRIWLHVRDTLPWRERKYSRMKSRKNYEGFEPMTSAIPVRCSTNWAISSTKWLQSRWSLRIFSALYASRITFTCILYPQCTHMIFIIYTWCQKEVHCFNASSDTNLFERLVQHHYDSIQHTKPTNCSDGVLAESQQKMFWTV